MRVRPPILRPALAATVLVAGLAGCWGAPTQPKPVGPTGTQKPRPVTSKTGAPTAIAGALRLEAPGGRDIEGLAAQTGGRGYAIKDGQLALPAEVLTRVKAEGKLALLVSGYLPRELPLTEPLPLIPLEAAQLARGLGPGAGEAGTNFARVAFPAGRLARPVDVTVGPYLPPAADAGALEATRGKLNSALIDAGAAAPTGCDGPLPACEQAAGGIGLLVAVDGMLGNGAVPITIDLDMLVRGWDGQGQAPWEAVPAGWREPERQRAAAAWRMIRALEAIAARPDAPAWRQALGQAFGLSFAGRELRLALSLGGEALVDGTVRIQGLSTDVLGAPLAITLVSATQGGLPTAARPAELPPISETPASSAPGATPSPTPTPAPAGGPSLAEGWPERASSTQPSAAPPAPAAFGPASGSNMGVEGGPLVLTAGAFTGAADDTLFGAAGEPGAVGDAILKSPQVAFTGRDGVSLIGGDAASIIGLDAADLLAHDGQPLGGAAGGAIAGPDGANLVGPDGVPLGDQAFSEEVPVASYRGSLIAANGGGTIAGTVRSPLAVPLTGYRLKAFTDKPAGVVTVWAMDGHGRPYAGPAISDATGAYRLDALRFSLSGLVLGAVVGPARLLAIAKAPGGGERSVLIDAASTGAASVVLAPLLANPGVIRPIDHDRYLTLVRTLRAQLTQADAEAIAKGPLPAAAAHTLAFCAAKGIPVDVNGTVTTVAGTPPKAGPLDRPVGLALDEAGGRLLVADRGNAAIQVVQLAGGAPTRLAEVQDPRALAFDPASGKLFVAQPPRQRILELANGLSATFAGPAQALATAPFGWPPGFVDGRVEDARFNVPTGLALGPGGALFVADAGNGALRKVALGQVTTVAGAPYAGPRQLSLGAAADARFDLLDGVAAGPAGGLYLADRRQHRILHVSPEGQVTTVAGDAQGRPGDADGFRGRARFRSPHGLTRDAAGNLYVADGDNDRIRKIAHTGFVTTVAGSARGFGDGHALAAKFENPVAIAVDRLGQVYVADYGNHAIRKITP